MLKQNIIFCLLILANSAYSRENINNQNIIIWDFGGLLFNPSKWGVARNIGLKYFLSYAIHDRKNPNIQNLIFKVLEKIDDEKTDQSKRAGTAEGQALPQIMCDWQEGKINGYEVIKKAKQHIKKLDKLKYFCSSREKELVKRTINAMFNPKILANNIYPLEHGIELLKECYYAKDSSGNSKNINIGFSNWDLLSFDIFYKKNKQFFKYFHNHTVSAKIEANKPKAIAFERIITSFGLNPKDIIFIDDQDTNVNGARKFGIYAIKCQNYNYKKLKEKLKALGVL